MAARESAAREAREAFGSLLDAFRTLRGAVADSIDALASRGATSGGGGTPVSEGGRSRGEGEWPSSPGSGDDGGSEGSDDGAWPPQQEETEAERFIRAVYERLGRAPPLPVGAPRAGGGERPRGRRRSARGSAAEDEADAGGFDDGAAAHYGYAGVGGTAGDVVRPRYSGVGGSDDQGSGGAGSGDGGRRGMEVLQAPPSPDFRMSHMHDVAEEAEAVEIDDDGADGEGPMGGGAGYGEGPATAVDGPRARPDAVHPSTPPEPAAPAPAARSSRGAMADPVAGAVFSATWSAAGDQSDTEPSASPRPERGAASSIVAAGAAAGVPAAQPHPESRVASVAHDGVLSAGGDAESALAAVRADGSAVGDLLTGMAPAAVSRTPTLTGMAPVAVSRTPTPTHGAAHAVEVPATAAPRAPAPAAEPSGGALAPDGARADPLPRGALIRVVGDISNRDPALAEAVAAVARSLQELGVVGAAELPATNAGVSNSVRASMRLAVPPLTLGAVGLERPRGADGSEGARTAELGSSRIPGGSGSKPSPRDAAETAAAAVASIAAGAAVGEDAPRVSSASRLADAEAPAGAVLSRAEAALSNGAVRSAAAAAPGELPEKAFLVPRGRSVLEAAAAAAAAAAAVAAGATESAVSVAPVPPVVAAPPLPAHAAVAAAAAPRAAPVASPSAIHANATAGAAPDGGSAAARARGGADAVARLGALMGVRPASAAARAGGAGAGSDQAIAPAAPHPAGGGGAPAARPPPAATAAEARVSSGARAGDRRDAAHDAAGGVAAARGGGGDAAVAVVAGLPVVTPRVAPTIHEARGATPPPVVTLREAPWGRAPHDAHTAAPATYTDMYSRIAAPAAAPEVLAAGARVDAAARAPISAAAAAAAVAGLETAPMAGVVPGDGVPRPTPAPDSAAEPQSSGPRASVNSSERAHVAGARVAATSASLAAASAVAVRPDGPASAPAAAPATDAGGAVRLSPRASLSPSPRDSSVGDAAASGTGLRGPAAAVTAGAPAVLVWSGTPRAEAGADDGGMHNRMGADDGGMHGRVAGAAGAATRVAHMRARAASEVVARPARAAPASPGTPPVGSPRGAAAGGGSPRVLASSAVPHAEAAARVQWPALEGASPRRDPSSPVPSVGAGGGGDRGGVAAVAASPDARTVGAEAPLRPASYLAASSAAADPPTLSPAGRATRPASAVAMQPSVVSSTLAVSLAEPAARAVVGAPPLERGAAPLAEPRTPPSVGLERPSPIPAYLMPTSAGRLLRSDSTSSALNAAASAVRSIEAMRAELAQHARVGGAGGGACGCGSGACGCSFGYLVLMRGAGSGRCCDAECRGPRGLRCRPELRCSGVCERWCRRWRRRSDCSRRRHDGADDGCRGCVAGRGGCVGRRRWRLDDAAAVSSPCLHRRAPRRRSRARGACARAAPRSPSALGRGGGASPVTARGGARGG